MPRPADTQSVIEELAGQLGEQLELIPAASVEAYAGQIARLRDAQARLEAEGLVVVDVKGAPVAHPCVAVEKAAQAEIRAWGDTFRPRRRR